MAGINLLTGGKVTMNRYTLDRRRQHSEPFVAALDREQLEQRIRTLARDGLGDYDIGELLRINVEQVRRVLAQRRETTT